jgi:hypothetical protein
MVANTTQFLSLLKLAQGHRLKDASVVKHDDASGDYESIVLEFQGDNGDAVRLTFTSNYQIASKDRDIIDTSIDVESARMVVDLLEKK